MSQTETKVLTAHVPLSLAEKVDLMATRLERSRGWIIKQALAAWIKQEEERNRLTLEALADVDAGHVTVPCSSTGGMYARCLDGFVHHPRTPL